MAFAPFFSIISFDEAVKQGQAEAAAEAAKGSGDDDVVGKDDGKCKAQVQYQCHHLSGTIIRESLLFLFNK